MSDVYDKARRKAYRALEARLVPLGVNIRAGMIGLRALQAWEATWPKVPEASHMYGGWPWDALAQHYNFPSRFDLAIWVGEDLCAMAIGDGVSSGVTRRQKESA